VYVAEWQTKGREAR